MTSHAWKRPGKPTIRSLASRHTLKESERCRNIEREWGKKRRKEGDLKRGGEKRNERMSEKNVREKDRDREGERGREGLLCSQFTAFIPLIVRLVEVVCECLLCKCNAAP